MVEAFAGAGADVVIGDLRFEDAKDAAQNQRTSHRRVVAVQTDVTKREDVEKLCDETLRMFRKIDVLVNCAGWDRLLHSSRPRFDLWQKVLTINFLGVVNTCPRNSAAHGRAQAGARSSTSVQTRDSSDHLAKRFMRAKAAIMAFSKTIAREHARDNIRVNVVSPGLCDTPLIDEMRRDDFTAKILGSIVNFIPLKRLGRPEEIAPMVLFLASDAASYITGQVFSINGGLNMVG